MFLLLFVTSVCYGQNMEKIMDKYNVQNSEVSEHLFSIGDTITLAVGSSNNGEFVSGVIPTYVGGPIPHLSANYNHNRFIIQKIRVVTQGLNSQTSIIIDLGSKSIAYIDAALAIDKNEIVLK
jgi:hypothetical protein